MANNHQSNYSYNNHYNSRKNRYAKKQIFMRVALYMIMLIMLSIIGVLAVFSINQHRAAQVLEKELDSLESRLEKVEQDNTDLEEKYEEIHEKNQELLEENEKLREENKMMRSETIIEHGSRETNKVAITIDDGGAESLTHRALDYFKEYNVQATLFPKGDIVEQQPEVWQRAVDEGHELGNHTYTHPYLSYQSNEKIKEELKNWQKAVDQSLEQDYRTLFFRPPYRDGYSSGQRWHKERIQEIVAEQGMFTILWDIETLHALQNNPYTTENITRHVLNNAQGGSIILLHFIDEDIAAIPDIITGLRDRGLEPVPLSEVLLAES